MKPSLLRALPVLSGLLFLCPAGSIRAQDSVHLKSGDLFCGKVLRANKEEVSIKLESGGIISFKANYVYRVRRWLKDKDIPEVIFYNEERPKEPAPVPVLTQPPPLPVTESPDPPPVVPPAPPDPGQPEGDPIKETRAAVEAPAKPAPEPMVIRDLSRWSWSFSPPAGFELQSPRGSADIVEAWNHPKTQAAIIFSAIRTLNFSYAAPEKFKELKLKEWSEGGKARLLRDKPIQRGGEGGYKGWILELERPAAGKPVQELHLFVQGGDAIFLLSFAAPISEYPSLAIAFETSLQSFRLYPMKDEEETKPAPLPIPVMDKPKNPPAPASAPPQPGQPVPAAESSLQPKSP